jgi:hypothetical protein
MLNLQPRGALRVVSDPQMHAAITGAAGAAPWAPRQRRQPRFQTYESRSTAPSPNGGPADSVSVCLGGSSNRSEAHTASGARCRIVRRHGPYGPVGRVPDRPSNQKGVVVLMSFRSWSATPGHRPLPVGSDTVPECRGGIRRWSG